jgi:hypothetical protein
MRWPSFQRHIEPALFSLFTTTQALIVLSAARPPLRDAPLYEATFSLLAKGAGTRSWFATDLLGSHGSLVFVLGRELTRALSAQTAFQLLMAFGVLALPWAFRTLCTVMGRGVLAAWIVAPLALHAGVFMGELRMTIGLALALSLIASALSLGRARTWLRESGLVVLSTTLFFTHAGLWLLAFSLAWFALFVRGRVSLLMRTRALLLAGALVILAVVCFDLSWLTSFDDDFRFLLADCEPSARLKDFALFVTYTLKGESADRLSKAWVLLITVAVTLALTTFSTQSAETRNVRLYVAGAAGASFLAFVLTPPDFDASWAWGIAAAGLCALLLLAALPLATGAVRAFLLAAFMVLAVWRASQVSDAFFAFRTQEVSDFHQALHKVPKRRHLLVLINDHHSAFVHAPVFSHYGAFYQALSPRALVAPVLGDTPGWPLTLHDDVPRPPLMEQRTMFAMGYVYPAMVDWADYVLTRGTWGSRPEDRAKLIFQGAAWNVYRVMPVEESFRARKTPSTSAAEKAEDDLGQPP